MPISKDQGRKAIEALYQTVLADKHHFMEKNIQAYLKGFGEKIIIFDHDQEIQDDYLEFFEQSAVEDDSSPFLTVVGDEIVLRRG